VIYNNILLLIFYSAFVIN